MSPYFVQLKYSLTSKGTLTCQNAQRNSPISGPLACPNLTRSSRSKKGSSRCLVSHDCDLLDYLHAIPVGPTGSSQVFISHGRLPWSTLESDLEKRGLALVNWPAEVPRKRNKGIYNLSAEHADKLYRAIMHPDEEYRLGFRSLGPAAGMYRSRCFALSSKYYMNHQKIIQPALRLMLTLLRVRSVL